jgi:hypothetical protein
MEHHILESLESKILRMQLFKKDNNLDQKDNLDEVPEETAVFTICGRVNGFAANPRYVGATKNLREAVKELFNTTDCVGQFMNSIKLKDLLYEVVAEDQLENKKAEWESKFKPQCNEVMNEVH